MLAQWIRQFNKIYVVCPTYGEDSVWSPLDKYVESGKIKVIDSVDENGLKKIWNLCREIKKSDPKYHSLIYFDDCGGQVGFRKVNENGVINQLTTKGNHSNISTIYVVQRLVFCSPTMRVNAECVITFYMQSESERKRLFEEYGVGSFKNFTKMIEESTKEPYSTFLVNRKGPGQSRYYHNFQYIKNPLNMVEKTINKRRVR